MGKKLGTKDNFRIVVYPRSVTDFGSISCSRGMFYGYDAEGQAGWERDMEDRCDELIADMKRHVDNFGSAEIEYDQEEVCEHCGYRWTEKDSHYNGGCCDEDEAAEQARIEAQSEL